MSAYEDYVNLEMPRRSTLLTKVITGYDADPNLGGAPAILQEAPLGTWFYEEGGNTWWRKRDAGATDWVDMTPGGGPGGFNRREQTFVPTLGQTVFTLTAAPVTPNDTSLFVNTVKYLFGIDYTVVGSALTWLDVEFALDSEDALEVIYFV